jgi:hypothetical protein
MGFVGAERAMQEWVYSHRGGLHAMHMEYVGSENAKVTA